jgi:site-specific DNA-methyltransferase (adenine-specific)
MAYLVMMTIRLLELHRVLKPTGSLYLHCDPSASHYLKIVLDQIFGPGNFRNEIVWKRTGAHNSAKRYGPLHDVLLFYSKTNEYKWNQAYQAQDEYIHKRYSYVDAQDRQFYPVSLLAAGTRQGSSGKSWRDIDVSKKGNHWRYTIEKLEELDKAGNIYWPSKGGMPRLKMYADDAKGSLLQDWWGDISPLNSQAAERLGYDTQKPQALLERIIQASSNEGDIVLDPFCGCGTAVVAAQKLNRKWIGIDVTHLAINLMRTRLKDSFGIDVEVIGEPADLESAKALARQDRYQFQWWALSRIYARAVGDQKKGADKGIDGVISFLDSTDNQAHRIIIQVKSGHVGAPTIRELKDVSSKEAMGVLLTLEEPTTPMLKEALDAGYYHSPVWDKDYNRIQIITIEDLLKGKRVDMPPQAQTNITFAKAPRVKRKEGEQGRLG